MIDWTASMQQTYEFYSVDPATWGDKTKLDQVTQCVLSRNDTDETLGSATIDTTELLDEMYVRIYLVCIQNGIEEKFVLGTYLVQTPNRDYNGKVDSISVDAYTPLLELKDDAPPLGYTVFRGSNILTTVSDLVSEHCRAPVVRVNQSLTLDSDMISDFSNDTWLSFLTDLLAKADYSFGLDEYGRILFQANARKEALRPIWTYDDGNSSILYPDISLSRDLYGVPNVVEVLFSTESGYKFSRIENNDENSPVSIPIRGRRVIYREENPEGLDNPSQEQIDDYAANLLRQKSSLEYTISYTHGYCPVRVGDAVWINYERAGLKNIKAVVVSQEINCRPGCSVSETAVYTRKLWGG